MLSVGKKRIFFFFENNWLNHLLTRSLFFFPIIFPEFPHKNFTRLLLLSNQNRLHWRSWSQGWSSAWTSNSCTGSVELLCQSDRSSSAGAVLLRFLLWARKKFEKNEQENSAEYARGKKYDSARRTDIIFFFLNCGKKLVSQEMKKTTLSEGVANPFSW